MSTTRYAIVSNGREVGSGFDVEIRRESDAIAIVNVMSPNGKRDWLGTWDIDQDTDLHALAIEIGSHPNGGDGFDMYALHDDQDDETAEGDVAERQAYGDSLIERWEALAHG